MNKITLYPYMDKIHFNYGEVSKAGGLIVEKTQEQIEFLVSGDLNIVLKRLSERYKEETKRVLDDEKHSKFTITGVNREIKFYPLNN